MRAEGGEFAREAVDLLGRVSCWGAGGGGMVTYHCLLLLFEFEM